MSGRVEDYDQRLEAWLERKLAEAPELTDEQAQLLSELIYGRSAR